MSKGSQTQPRPFFLGIEGGGSHTIAILADARGHLLKRIEAGPANLRLLDDTQLRQLFASIAAAMPRPDALGIGMAGVRAENDRERVRKMAAHVWPGIPCHATDDLETALAAADEKNAAAPGSPLKNQTRSRSRRGNEADLAGFREEFPPPHVGGYVFAGVHVLILSGTGSCCYGRNAAGKTAKIGGWGHLLGDKGSGYEIGLRALKAVLFYFDRDGTLPRLGRQILHRLQMNEPVELIAWAQGAEKSQIASLAVEVFEAWPQGDRIARDILAGAAESLAEDGLACARKLTGSRNAPIHFILAGSILLKQPRFAREVAKRLKHGWPAALIKPLKRESAWGAVELARRLVYKRGEDGGWRMEDGGDGRAKERISRRTVQDPESEILNFKFEMPLSQLGKSSPTEQRNPRSRKLDQLPVAEAVELMLSEDAKIPAAIRAEAKKIERAVKLIAQAFKGGGRLIYIGAGTSGRLGVLDASECPPTFRTPPELVQGIIAGGQSALWKSVEGAEDDSAAGARAVEFRSVTRRDVVVGITASGRTPFVWGALGQAKARGAKTILLAFNPHLVIPSPARPTLVITPDLGPEILTGSTRLKAGTATKLILNIFTTLAMVRIGKVISNLMVDLNPSNTKLRDRAVRIVQELCGVDYATAERALVRSHWVVKQARARLMAVRPPRRRGQP